MNEKNLPAVIQSAITAQAIDRAKVNLMLPTESFGEILGEYDKVVIEIVTINSDEKAGEVFPIGGKKALSKIPLQKIGNALGVVWDPVTTTILESTSRKSRAKATGAIKKPNGEYIVISEEKTVDLDVFEEELYLSKAEDADKGAIVDWKESASGKKYPVRCAWKSEQEKEAWIKREVQKAMIQYKKFKDERAMTGAKTRVIRALIAIKSAYTDEELSKPFAFPKIMLDTNKLLSNPEARQAALERMTGSVNAIFGVKNEPRNVTPEPAQITTFSAPDEGPEDAGEIPDIGIDPDEIPWNEDQPAAPAKEDLTAEKRRLQDLFLDESVQRKVDVQKSVREMIDRIEAGTATKADALDRIHKVESWIEAVRNAKGGRK